MKHYKVLLIALLIIYNSTFAQEVETDNKKISNKQGIEKVDSPQAIGDKVKIKDGSTLLLEINNEGSAGSIIFPSIGSSRTGSKLYNNGDNLFWGETQLNIVGGASSINELSDAKYDGSSLFLGASAGGINDDGGNNNIAVGLQSLNNVTSGTKNIAIGFKALYSNTTGGSNTALGTQTLNTNSTGAWNTAIGYQALFYNTSGNGNTAIGFFTNDHNTTGFFNTSVGYKALEKNTTGDSNIAVGSSALYTNLTGTSNVAIGESAGYYSMGHNNIMIGGKAGRGIYSIGSVHGNVILGNKAGYKVQGDDNVFIGKSAGYNETGSSKLYIENSNSSSPLIWGDFANDKVAINGKLGVGTSIMSDRMVIIALATENALRVKVGDATKLRVLANGGTTLGANNTAGTPTDGLYIHGDVLYNGSHTATSDARFKTNIEQIDDALDKIKNIRGVNYNWRTQEFPDRDFSEDRQIGVLAQEIEKEFPELVQTDQDGYKSVDYAKLTPILLEAIKDLTARVEKLEEERTEL